MIFLYTFVSDMIGNEILFFTLFVLGILAVLLLDLGVFSKKNHQVSFKEASIWTLVWISFAIAFYFFLSYYGHIIHGIQNMNQLEHIVEHHQHSIHLVPDDFQKSLNIYNKNLGIEYLTGYVIEYALSIDNVFVILLIFLAFGVKKEYYKKVLFWGILGAIIMRFLFIFSAAALIHQFSWILYVFGVFLVFTGIKMLFSDDDEKIDPGNHTVVKLAGKFFNVYKHAADSRFFVKLDNKTFITPLFITLLVIEFSDVIFAVDSIPAIFSVTNDPYIVFFSNIFAIIGLRSLFFLVMNIMTLFRYLKIGLSALLVFIGLKLLFHHHLETIGFTTVHSLLVIIGILGLSIIASLLNPEKKKTT